jgi:hypothetical protein
MMTQAFATTVDENEDAFSGPWRNPRNLLSEQTYGGHASVHDDATARQMGFAAAPIEGPTHFSQFAPLCCHVWGDRWLSEGGLSVSYKAAVLEGEKVKAFIAKPAAGETQLAVWMTKEDGTEVLRGTVMVGSENEPTPLEQKLGGLPSSDPRRVIFRKASLGTQRSRVRASLDYDCTMGALYPFTLREKLIHITEPSAWYERGAQTPWGGPILPIEMISVLVHHVAESDPWLPEKPTVDLFVDQEIRLRRGPLLPEAEYEIERTLIGLSASKRTESCWVRSDVFLPGGAEVLASMVLNVASFKDSYPGYKEELAQMDAGAG